MYGGLFVFQYAAYKQLADATDAYLRGTRPPSDIGGLEESDYGAS